MKSRLVLQKENFEKLTKEILLTEREWEFLLQIQAYYYLVMDMDWRQQHDWIHRDVDGRLLTPLQAIADCARRNLRLKTECDGFAVKNHFETNIQPNLGRMAEVQPNGELLKKVRGLEVTGQGRYFIESFLQCLECLMKKSFTNLGQHNKTLWMHIEFVQMHEQLKTDVSQQGVKSEEM